MVCVCGGVIVVRGTISSGNEGGVAAAYMEKWTSVAGLPRPV